MRRTILAAAFTSLIVTWAGTASADIFHTFHSTRDYIRRGQHRNVLWPFPHVCPDRIAAREPFEIMVRNGWRRQNLLGSHHFDPTTNKLNVAGELQVRWIMTQAPRSRRQVFIERSLHSEVTAARVAAARQYATLVAIDGQQPQVAETSLIAEGRPAATVDWTNTKFMENMVPPVLPPPQGSP